MSRQHTLHTLDRLHQVRQFRRREVSQPKVPLPWAHEDVAREQGLQVDKGEGMRRGQEDLGSVSPPCIIYN